MKASVATTEDINLVLSHRPAKKRSATRDDEPIVLAAVPFQLSFPGPYTSGAFKCQTFCGIAFFGSWNCDRCGRQCRGNFIGQHNENRRIYDLMTALCVPPGFFACSIILACVLGVEYRAQVYRWCGAHSYQARLK
jgi:hypothetical protein